MKIYFLITAIFVSSIYGQNIDSVFAMIRADSLRTVDSIALIAKKHAAEDLAAKNKPVAPPANLAAAHFKADSCAVVVEADSIALRRVESGFFRGQINLKGKIDVDTRLQCIDFLLLHKLRSSTEVLRYLTILQKWNLDRMYWIYFTRATLPDEDKYKAVAVYRHAQEQCVKTQSMIDKITLK